MATETRIDARGLKCPLPVLKLEKALAKAPRGQRLIVLTTDPMARIDIPLHCRQNGHGCEADDTGDFATFTIVAGGLL